MPEDLPPENLFDVILLATAELAYFAVQLMMWLQ